MKWHWILILLFYLHMVASPHDGFDLLYHSKNPWKGTPSWKAIGFPCSREEKEEVKQEQRATGSWTVLRVWSWSTETLLPNSPARQNPGTALQTDKQQPAWTALHALTNTPLDVRYITIHFAVAVLLPMFQNRYIKAQFLSLGLYVSSRDESLLPRSTCLIHLLFQIRFTSFVFSFKDTRQAA